MKTSDVIQTIGQQLTNKDVAVFANGRIVKEGLFLLDRDRNFYMLLSMGHAASIGLGLALSKPNLKIVIFDGDGNLLMNFGILSLIGYLKPKNLIQIVIDNSAYGTTGGQKTVSSENLFVDTAIACGYKQAKTVKNQNDLAQTFKKYKSIKGPTLITAKVSTEYLTEAPIFNLKPEYIKERFTKSING